MIFTPSKSSLLIRNEFEQIRITAWGTDAFRVQATKKADFLSDGKGLLPTESPQEMIFQTDESQEKRAAGGFVEDCFGSSGTKTVCISNGALRCEISRSGCLSFFRGDRLLLREYYRNGVNELHSRAISTKARTYYPHGADYEIVARFESEPKEKIFGMGQYQQPELNLKGCVLDLEQHNTQITIPFYLSNQGYGFLWNHPGIGEVAFGKNQTKWTATCADELDYWITTGETPKEILAHYSEVTGRAPQFPSSALGLWQSKLRYRTQEEVLSVAREYHRRGIPLDVIVIDFFHWAHHGDWAFDPEYWPDPKAMVEELKTMGIRCAVSVWPTIEQDSPNFVPLQEMGGTVRNDHGTMQQLDWSGRNTRFLDATNPMACDFLWEQLWNNYGQYGIDIFWLDINEGTPFREDYSHRYWNGSAEKTTNQYPNFLSETLQKGLISRGASHVVNLSRSAWVGSQRFGVVVWSGDVESDFTALRDQLSAGLNIGMAGIPWWCTDTAGFHGDITDPYFQELMVRWFQFSTFTTVLRLHGDRNPHNIPDLSDHGGGKMHTGAGNELWCFGDKVYGILKKYLDIRLSMKDYILSLTKEASQNGSPVIRPMFYEFPDDPFCWELDDQYMFGGHYLVAPILEQGMTRRTVYLPDGRWKNFHTGEILTGGQKILADAPLEIIPVFEKISE